MDLSGYCQLMTLQMEIVRICQRHVYRCSYCYEFYRKVFGFYLQMLLMPVDFVMAIPIKDMVRGAEEIFLGQDGIPKKNTCPHDFSPTLV